MKSVGPLWLCTDIICVSEIRLCMMLIIIKKNTKHETPYVVRVQITPERTCLQSKYVVLQISRESI